MSDRSQSSVRTDSREEAGVADGEPAAATPSSDVAPGKAGGATAAGAVGKRAAAPVADPAPQDQAAGADGTQVIGPNSVPSGVFAAQAAPSGDGGPVRSAPPAGSPLPPAAVLPGWSPGSAPGAGRPAGTRTPVGSAPPAGTGPDSTQSVPLPAAGTRPSGRGQAGGPPPVPEESGQRRGRAARGPRRARLQLRHIDTFSALKISLVLSIALFFVWMIAVGILYGVLNGLGVFTSINDLIGQVGSVSGTNTSGGDVITVGVVMGSAAVIGLVNVVLLTALCTVATIVYNLCSDLVGGLEVTLAERE
jgi:hypothetical protein